MPEKGGKAVARDFLEGSLASKVVQVSADVFANAHRTAMTKAALVSRSTTPTNSDTFVPDVMGCAYDNQEMRQRTKGS